MKVLLTSGYSPDIAGQELRLAPGQSFLRKPFGPAELLDAVRAGFEI